MNLALLRESVSGLIILLMVNKLVKVQDYIRISPECDQIHLRPHLHWEVLWKWGTEAQHERTDHTIGNCFKGTQSLLLLFNM